jgi:hypothetical protein
MGLKGLLPLALSAIALLSACGDLSTATSTPISAPVPTPVATVLPIASPTAEAPVDTCVVPANGAAVCVTPRQISIDPGDMGQFSINIKPGEHGISGVELVLSFDPNGIRVIATEPRELLGADPIVGIEKIDQTAGKIWVALARVGPTDSPSPGGSFISVSFQVHEAAEPTSTLPLMLTTVNLVDELFAGIVQVHLEDGQISIGDP